MKLVEQVTLVFRKGRTEKVYEVDLCEVGAGKYVVNYRYGRRGGTLKDGTKTLAPVSETKARAAYDKLVESKKKAGYLAGEAHAVAPEPEPAAPARASAPTPSAAPEPITTAPRVVDPRAQGILDRLARGDGSAASQALPRAQRHLAFRRRRGSGDKTWKLSRAIWRAGELRLREAAPLIAGLAGSGDGMRDYAIAWALGRCGDPQSKSALIHLREKAGVATHTKRVALASLLELADGDERLGLMSGLRSTLPDALRGAAKEGPPERTVEVLAELLSHDGQRWTSQDASTWAAVETLYLMNTPFTRHAAIEAMRFAPLAPPSFKVVRAVFKLAELRRDGEMFGVLARRFDIERAMYRVGEWGSQVPGHGHMSDAERRRMMGSAQATAAFSSKTRWYLRQRVWRTLSRMGDAQDPDYVPMAVGVLAPFSDADALADRWSYAYRHLWAFNHILFTHSSQVHRSDRSWYGPRGFPDPPAQRGEAYPHLWDRQPTAILHLLSESGAEVVHQFGVSALRNLHGFVRTLPVDAIAMLLTRPFDVTVRFSFGLAQARYRPGASESELRELALAVANCVVQDIRRQGHDWIQSSPLLFIESGAILGSLLASPHADTRAFTRRFLADRALKPSVVEPLVASMVAAVLSMSDEALAGDVVASLGELFPAQLLKLGREVLIDLAKHALASVQGFAAQVMLLDGATPPPEEALMALIESPHASVRPFGVRVLAKLTDADLLQRHELVWSLVVHRDGSLREAAQPALARLIAADGEMAAMFLQKLIASLLRRRLPEGAPGFVVKVLREEFSAMLKGVPGDVVWRLLRSGSSAAQELGGVLLPRHLDEKTMDLAQLVELSNHKILSVREAAWGMASKMVSRLKGAMATAVRLLDADWEDSRVFAFKLFDEHFDKSDFTPVVLVSICDSVRPDVQRFGRKLIAEHFEEAHGEEYLLKLSEHPGTDVQLFATNYLERYAAGKTHNLSQLVPYFTRVLSQINRGRAARHRAHAFLRSEALASEDAARIVAGILEHQSATAAVEDRAACIETMAAIRRAWPNVELPIEVITAPTKRRASA